VAVRGDDRVVAVGPINGVVAGFLHRGYLFSD
jgi:hypothetical protein